MKKRAASQQKQRNRVVIKSSLYGNVLISGGQNRPDTTQLVLNYGGTSAFPALRNLCSSSYFQSMLQMYDQVRLDGFKIKITPTKSILLQGQKQAVFVSAWDRNGINNATEVPSYSEIASYSSAFQRAINMDATTWSATRAIRSSTIQEKSAFIPTSMFIELFSADGQARPGVGQNMLIPWNPVLLFGVLFSSATTANGPQPGFIDNQQQVWNYIAECEWVLTFRGLRYDIPQGTGIVNASVANNSTAAVALGQIDINPTGMETDMIPAIQQTTQVSQPLHSSIPVSTVITLFDWQLLDFVNQSQKLTILRAQYVFGKLIINPGNQRLHNDHTNIRAYTIITIAPNDANSTMVRLHTHSCILQPNASVEFPYPYPTLLIKYGVPDSETPPSEENYYVFTIKYQNGISPVTSYQNRVTTYNNWQGSGPAVEYPDYHNLIVRFNPRTLLADRAYQTYTFYQAGNYAQPEQSNSPYFVVET